MLYTGNPISHVHTVPVSGEPRLKMNFPFRDVYQLSEFWSLSAPRTNLYCHNDVSIVGRKEYALKNFRL